MNQAPIGILSECFGNNHAEKKLRKEDGLEPARHRRKKFKIFYAMLSEFERHYIL